MNELLCNSFENTSLTKFELRNITTKQQFKDYILSLPNPYFQEDSLFEVSANGFALRYDSQNNGWYNLTPNRAVYAFDCSSPKSISIKFHYTEQTNHMMQWSITFVNNIVYCPIFVYDGSGDANIAYNDLFINNTGNITDYVVSNNNRTSRISLSNFTYTWENNNFIPFGNYRCYVFNYRYMLPKGSHRQCNPPYFEYLTIEF